MRSRAPLATVLLPLAILLGTSAPPAYAEGSIPFTEILSAGPLEDIYVGDDLSCQVELGGIEELYGGDPGDCGTLVAYGDVLYTPNFEGHEYTATGYESKEEVTPEEIEANPEAQHNALFKPVSQSAVSGSGTEEQPFAVTTVVDAGSKLRLTQTDSYVAGQDYYTVVIHAENLTGSPLGIELYRAQDCYLNGVDEGFGFEGTSECTSSFNNEPPGYVEALVPSTEPAFHYFENEYEVQWNQIGTRQPLPDTCTCSTELDNADSISWSLTIPAHGTESVSVEHVFSLTGAIPAPPARPLPPSSRKSPSVPTSGAPTVGREVTAEVGAFEGAESYAYQWERCTNTEPSSCAAIPGATAPGYKPTSADVGEYLRFVVTATNSSGSTVAESPPIGPVLATPVISIAPPAAAKVCRSERTETIHWKTRGVKLAHITVTVNGKVQRRLAGDARKATVSLVGLTRGAVTVVIRGTTGAGKVYAATRVYHPCLADHAPATLKTRFLRHG
jgi:hypothetical protein